MALTMAAAKAAGPRPRAYKLFDAGGLHLHVAPTGTKSWRWKYRRGGREQLATLGRFPELSLAQARTKRDEHRANLGSTPGLPVVGNEKIDTFEQLARAWHARKRAPWSQVHAADVLASLERWVFPAIGARPAASIEAADLATVLERVEAAGRIETAKRVCQRLRAIFAWAVTKRHVPANPTADLGAALDGVRLTRPQPALTNVDDCRALLAACDHIAGAGNMVVLASRLLALTAVRLAAVRGMRWSEVEGLESGEPLWRVPAARMKLSQAKKGEARFDHLVPLSPQAVRVLRELAGENGHDTRSPDALVFPGLAAGAIRRLYARTEFIGRHVPHGWRASFSTILNEDLGPEWRSDVDRALAHSPKDKVEGAYNRAQLLDRRRELFNRWGELLADLLSVRPATAQLRKP